MFTTDCINTIKYLKIINRFRFQIFEAGHIFPKNAYIEHRYINHKKSYFVGNNKKTEKMRYI